MGTRFRITHPFHPWHGREFEVALRCVNWGEDRVEFEGERGARFWVPARWTSLVEPDLFIVVAAGRSPFRPDDLLRLAELIEGLRGTKGGAR